MKNVEVRLVFLNSNHSYCQMLEALIEHGQLEWTTLYVIAAIYLVTNLARNAIFDKGYLKNSLLKERRFI